MHTLSDGVNMPRLRPETERARAIKLTKDYIKTNLNQTRLAEKEGVTSQNINQRLARVPVQKTLDEHIQRVAKKIGINLTWLLRKYKIGAEEAEKIIGYLHQYKKNKGGNIEKIKPDEVVSSEFITTKDWLCQRLYLRDIAEIMKWIKTNGKNGNSVSVINIIYGYRVRPVNSAIRPEK